MLLPFRAVATSTFLYSPLVILLCSSLWAADPPAGGNKDIYSAARSAVLWKQLEKTQGIGFNGDKETFSEVLPEGGILVGFDLGVGKFFDKEVIFALKPLYETAQGDAGTNSYGLFKDKTGPNKKVTKSKVVRTVRLRAKPGYAVGAVNLRTGLFLDGMSVTYMRINGKTLDPESTYTSSWVGIPAEDRAKTIGGDGSPVVGIFGYTNEQDITALGLIYIKQPPPPVRTQPVTLPPNQPVDKPNPPAGTQPRKPEALPHDPLDPPAQPVVPEGQKTVEEELGLIPPRAPDRILKEEPDEVSTEKGLSWFPFAMFGMLMIAIGMFLLVYLGGASPPQKRPQGKKCDEDETT